MKNPKAAIEIYHDDLNKDIEVKLKNDTVWLTLGQIAKLFDVKKPAVSKHIKNIYRSGELDKNRTVSKMETVQTEGKRKIKRNLTYFNLDVIIAVGYRVNSKKATQFRIWATNVLKKYLLEGYIINQKRLTENQLEQLEKTIDFIKQNIRTEYLSAKEVKGFLEIIEKYSKVWEWIDLYDRDILPPGRISYERKPLTYEEATEVIALKLI